MSYINTIPYNESTGELREIYDGLIKGRGKLAAVHQIQSLNPQALIAHMELYKAVMFNRSPLKRYQQEMIAVVVSAANQCRYCIRHHQEALNFYWKDEARTQYLVTDRTQADLSDRDEGLCAFAEALTRHPGQASEADTQRLRDLGLEDRAILDATQVVAYFNFVNRLVQGLGVELSEEDVKGYRY
jgi:uncharacterized peroxidase-related enzyme